MKNEYKIFLRIFKDYNKQYNANSLSKKIGISVMGVLKILKRLESKDILISKQLGRAKFYSINFNSDYARDYFIFSTRQEIESSNSGLKVWISEFKKIRGEIQAGMLFGSIINKNNFNDVDMFVLVNKKDIKKLEEEIKKIDKVSSKKIHLIKQTERDLKSSLKKDKKLESIFSNCIFIFGQDKFWGIFKNVFG